MHNSGWSEDGWLWPRLRCRGHARSSLPLYAATDSARVHTEAECAFQPCTCYRVHTEPRNYPSASDVPTLRQQAEGSWRNLSLQQARRCTVWSRNRALDTLTDCTVPLNGYGVSEGKVGKLDS